MNVFYIKEGDLWPPLEAYLKQADGEAIPLQESDDVILVLSKHKNRKEVVLQSQVEVVNLLEGHVRYAWNLGDTDTPGDYQGEFIILLDGDTPIKIPNNGYFKVVIDHKLGEQGGN